MTTISERLGYEDNRPFHHAWLVEHVIERFALVPSDLLDVGCADGFWTSIFHEEGFRVTGVERDADAVVAGLRKYPHLNLEIGDYWSNELPRSDVVFGRTLREFYGVPDLSAFAQLVRHLSRYGERVVLCVYSDESGTDAPDSGGTPHRNHPGVEYVRAARSACATASVDTHTASGYVIVCLTW